MKIFRYFALIGLCLISFGCALTVDHGYTDLTKIYPPADKSHNQIHFLTDPPEGDYEEIGFAVIHGQQFAQPWRKRLKERAIEMGGDAIILLKGGSTFITLVQTAVVIKYK